MKNIKLLIPNVSIIIFLLSFFFLFNNYVNFYKVKLDNSFFYEDGHLLFINEVVFNTSRNKKFTNFNNQTIFYEQIILFGKIHQKGEFLIFNINNPLERIDLIKLSFFLNFLQKKENRNIQFTQNAGKIFDLSQKLIQIEKVKINFLDVIINYIYSILFIYSLLILIFNVSIKNK